MLAGDTNVQCWFYSSPAALGADSGTSSVGKIGSRSAMNSAWLGDGPPARAWFTPSSRRGSGYPRQDCRHSDKSPS